MAKLTRDYKTLLILTGFLFAAASFYFFYAVPFVDKKIRDLKDRSGLIAIRTDEVDQLEIRNRHGIFKFQKDLKTWKMTVPLMAGGDVYIIENIINYFEDIKVRSIVTENITQAELIRYGLKDPEFIITLLKKNTADHLTLNVGDLTPDGMGVYAYRSDRQEIIILPMYLTILLNRNVYELRDKNVFYFDIDKVRQVEIEFAQHRIILEKISEKNWIFKEPLNGEAADYNEVKRILDQLKWINVLEFYDSDEPGPVRHGLDDPWAGITVMPDNSVETQGISLGFVHGLTGIYAKNNDSGDIFLLPIDVTGLFMEDIYPLRDKSVFNFDYDEITGFQLDYAGSDRDIKLTRMDSNTWEINNPEQKSADTDAVVDYLRDLRSIKSKKLLPYTVSRENTYGFEDPELMIRLEKNSLQFINCIIGKPLPDDPDFIYARRTDEDEVILLDRDLVETIKKNQLYFKYKHLFQFDIGRVYKVDLLYNNTETSVRRFKNDKWQALSPKALSPGKKSINRFPILLLMRDLWKLESAGELPDSEINALQEAEIKIGVWIEDEQGPVVYSIWNYGELDNFFIVKIMGESYIVERNQVQLIEDHLSQIYAQLR